MLYLKLILCCILIMFFFFDTNFAAEKVICISNKTINYNQEGIIFFESLNFPLGIIKECNLTFIYKYPVSFEKQNNFQNTIIVLERLKF